MMKDIKNNYTPANIAKLKKGYFFLEEEIDYQE